jgi:SAM-dependent methyltransferase/tetratricopeptide (TPR) repeat protein
MHLLTCSVKRGFPREEASAHNNRGVRLFERGHREKAADRYTQALAVDVYCAEAHNNLGVALKALGKPLEAILHHQVAIRLRPGDPICRRAFVECLSDLQLTRVSESLEEDILAALTFEGINPQGLAFPLASLVRNIPACEELDACLRRVGGSATLDELMEAGLADLHANRLLIGALSKAILRDPSIERTMTEIRRALLHAVTETDSVQPRLQLLSFVCAMGRQCFANEYVYYVSDDERRALQTLEHRLECSGSLQPDARRLLIAVLACYRPLGDDRYRDLIRLIPADSNDGVAELVMQQVTEPAREQQLTRTIRSVGSIADGISARVRAQYEVNPYPRWLAGDRPGEESLRGVMRTLLPHVPPERLPDTLAPQVLVAGCGTGQEVIKRSFQFPSARIVAVDLSLASLAYAKRKAIDLERHNVEFVHGDILQLDRIGESFDIIECVGVLHHMRDPVAGWRMLVKLLKPGGFMRIGLYSEAARRHIAAAQALVTARGYAATPDGIRQCRRDLLTASEANGASQVRQIVDFYTLSETRDLLFHVQEHRFTLPKVASIIDALGVACAGFEVGTSVREAYLERFPDDPTATSLAHWHEYELSHPDTFMGLYLLWMHKSVP